MHVVLGDVICTLIFILSRSGGRLWYLWSGQWSKNTHFNGDSNTPDKKVGMGTIYTRVARKKSSSEKKSLMGVKSCVEEAAERERSLSYIPYIALANTKTQ